MRQRPTTGTTLLLLGRADEAVVAGPEGDDGAAAAGSSSTYNSARNRACEEWTDHSDVEGPVHCCTTLSAPRLHFLP